MEAKKKKLVLVDASALIHRAFHALPPLTTKKGEPTGAVYGFTSTLLKAISELKPDYIACAFDYPAKTFRHEEFKEYKATRVKAPAELYDQIKRVKEVVDALNIAIFELEGYEADDIIASIDKKAGEEGLETIIVTGDLDTLQLVDEDTKVYTLKKGITETIIYDKEKVKEKYRIDPEKLIDFKALRGDPSDNIPGVKGIGEKTAIELLIKYGSLENIYKNLEKIKPLSLKEKLEKGKESAFLSKKLVRLIKDLPLKLDFQKCKISEIDKEKVVKLFKELEFKTLLDRLSEILKISEKPEVKKKIKQDYQLITNEKDLDKLINKLSNSDGFAIDLETSGPDPMDCKLVGISFAIEEGEAFYLPVGHRSGEQLDLDLVLKKIKPVLENSKIPKYGHSLKFDFVVLLNYQIEIKNIEFDTMIAAWLLEGRRAPKLEALAFTELGYQMMPISDLIGRGRNQLSFDQVPISKACFYSCEDADLSLRLRKIYKERLEKEPEIKKIFYEIEIPLIKVLGWMEFNGVKIDVNFLKDFSKELEREIKNLEESIYDLAGCEFNIRSTQQLAEVLFDKLKLTEKVKKTKTGRSTAATELEKLRGLHPIIDLILEYRELTKLKSTYVDALPLLVNEKTERVHTSFNQAITTTGRLSSSNPNLQNIPIRGDLGKKIRKAFIAENGFKFVSADYSQIELRLAAHLAEDENMIKAFKEGKDIHQEVASFIFKVPPSQVTPDLRRAAKTINFGILYGMSPFGLAEATGMKKEDAQKYIENYFKCYPKIKKYIENTLSFCRENGWVETLFGRRRFIPEINSGVYNIRAAAERMAINHPIQGTAADIIKLAMIEIHQKILMGENQIKLLLQVHDELLFEVKEELIEKFIKEIKKIMEEVVKLKVPLLVDVSIGENWGEMEEYKFQ